MANRDAIVAALDQYLGAERFKDFAPNGLQVEGAAKVARMVTGVSLSQELIEQAAVRGAQMLLVHHGTFWKDQSPVVKGAHKARLRALLEHDISLVGYHLPLDAHPVVGNNAQILQALGRRKHDPFGDYHGQTIGFSTTLNKATTVKQITRRLGPICSGKPFDGAQAGPIWFPGRAKVRKVGVVSGGAGSMFNEAIAAGLDLFITGELWEPAQALAKETGVGFLALGHYNSEKPGVMALGAWVERRFRIRVDFVDVPNLA